MQLINKIGKWRLVFIALFAVFALLVIFDYLSLNTQLCKSSIPFSATWSANFPTAQVKYFISEDNNMFKIKFIYFDNEKSANAIYSYLELFNKDSNKSEFFYTFENKCIKEVLTKTEPYFNPFEVNNCVGTRGALIQIISNDAPEEEFAPPQNCELRTDMNDNDFISP